MTASPSQADTPADDRLDKGVLKIAGVTVLGAIMSILDVTVVSVALPTFQQVFDAQYSTVAWTMTAYTLALATVIPLTGWAADRFGTKRLYILALTAFTLGSVLCSLAWSIESLIIFRVVQGLGGGMLMPLGMTILTRAAGPARIGRVMAVLGVPMLLGPIAGPILGGWLIEIASWHWIFLINLPIGVLAVILAARVFDKDVPTPSQSFDFVGMLLLSPGLALFLFGVSSIPETGTAASARVIIPAVVGVVLMAAFVWHALRKDHPLIDLRLFRHRSLTAAVLTMSLFAVAFFGAGLLFPSYFIQVRMETTLDAGLLLAPQGLGAMVTMPIVGRLVDKYGPGRFVLFGLVLIVGGMGVFTQLTNTTPYIVLLGALFVMGLGMGSTMMPIMTGALAALRPVEVARGSTLMNIIQQSAGSIGTALLSVLLTNSLQNKPAVELANGAAAGNQEAIAAFTPQVQSEVPVQAAEAFASTFWVAAVLMLLCFIPALMLPRKPAVQQAGAAPVVMH
ncbi:DHA2 family efflux MFS transporter permease subunit [Nakamurella leprariae]|uniref:DHA2 family efflux MFS transporter permease subunit n=1 Tax=Nakamurella leprariae TaxID=2803911 RepID=UPI002E2E2CCD|nr:DHA2 family efflux MFS transporter permease subunit [Nakamurella leprariae]